MSWECSICLESLASPSSVKISPTTKGKKESGPDEISTTQCGHVFHSLCLNNWLKSHRKCPLCRVHVHKSEIVRVFPTALSTTEPSTEIVPLAEVAPPAKVAPLAAEPESSVGNATGKRKHASCEPDDNASKRKSIGGLMLQVVYSVSTNGQEDGDKEEDVDGETGPLEDISDEEDEGNYCLEDTDEDDEDCREDDEDDNDYEDDTRNDPDYEDDY